MSKVQSFFAEVRAELGKVTWISFEEFLGNLVVVCIVVAFASIILGVMDTGFGAIMRKIYS